jgi:hypothetical protein
MAMCVIAVVVIIYLRFPAGWRSLREQAPASPNPPLAPAMTMTFPSILLLIFLTLVCLQPHLSQNRSSAAEPGARSEAEVNAAGGSRSWKGWFLFGRAVRNGCGRSSAPGGEFERAFIGAGVYRLAVRDDAEFPPRRRNQGIPIEFTSDSSAHPAFAFLRSSFPIHRFSYASLRFLSGPA